MIFQNKPNEEKKNTATESINLDKDIQYNCQDLDQEQKVEVNPVQSNNQNLHIYLNNDTNFYSKINGTTYTAKNKEFVANAEIFLFFGLECKTPVYKTNSDDSGNFVIEEIPPGYYTIFAQHGSNLKYRSSFIKVLPGANVNHLIYLNTWM